MKKLYSLLTALFLVCLASSAMAGGEVTGIVNGSASGTTSATAFVAPSADFVNLTDLSWRLDSGVNTGLLFVRSGEIKYSVSSATSASGTTVWFANTGSNISVGSYCIVQQASSGTFFLRQVNGASTTSVTVTESLSPALTTNDLVWSVTGSYARAVTTTTSPTAGNSISIWLPKKRPTAITVDGNTTACRVSFSGITTGYR